MTKRQRAQVVELLRCIYDLAHGTQSPNSMVGQSSKTTRLAIRAIKSTRETIAPTKLGLRDACLEAAARVEEGSWP